MMNEKGLSKFFVASVFFFVWVTVQGALQAQEPIHNFLELPPAGIIVGAHVHIGTLGWISLSLMGIFYYLVPRLSEKPLSWPGLVNWIFWLETIFIPLMAILMILAGISGGRAYQAGITGDALGAVIGPYMMLIGIVSIICGLTAILFSVQIIHTVLKKA